MAGEVQPMKVTINGGGVASAGQAIVLTSRSPQDTNTLSDPRNIVPVFTRAGGLGRNFEYRFQPYSVTVLQIGAGRNYRSDSSEDGK
jgi:alpha-L-arabinofuranosidase